MNPQDYPTVTTDNGDCNVVGRKFWAPSKTFEATFLNRKPLLIEYTFDASRRRGERVLVTLGCLLPVLGGIIPPGLTKMTSRSKLYNVIDTHVHLNLCSDRQHARCPCHLLNDTEERYKTFMKPLLDDCEYGHFHHFCSKHVVSWLNRYLYPLILYRESKELFDQEMAEWYPVLYLNNKVFSHTCERVISEFLLRNAEEMIHIED